MSTLVAGDIDPIEAQNARGLLVSDAFDTGIGDEQFTLANRECRLAVGGARLRASIKAAQRAHAVLRAKEPGGYALGAMTMPAESVCPTEKHSRADWHGWR